MYILWHLSAVASPLLGGVILASMGFGTLFLIVSFLIIFSISPLVLMKEYRGAIRFHLGSMKFLYNKKLAVLFLLQGILLSSEILMWPLFVFSVFGDIVTVGITVTLSAAAIAIITMFIGELTDRIGKKKLLNILILF